MTFTSYSVGAFSGSGQQVGGEFDSLDSAQCYFSLLSQEMASVALYAWTDEGECEELDYFAG